MATNTYVALDKVTLGSAAATVTFNSISSAYTDLVIVCNTYTRFGSETASTMWIRFNGDTGTNYSTTGLSGNGTSASSSRVSNSNYAEVAQTMAKTGTTSTVFTPAILQIMNYRNSTNNKTILSRSGNEDGTNNTSRRTDARGSLWRNTAAITSITIGNDAIEYLAGSTFELYGILAEGVSPTTKATGGAVYSDDVYYYHVFGASGTFTPTQSITADVLVVAGGGGGGGWLGGGGGAGGLLGFNSQSLNSGTSYTVTVGSGGAKSSSNTSPGSNGSDSQFASLTLVKGGGYGGVYTGAGGSVPNGNTGGSGGGGGGQVGATSSGGSGTSGQGNAGGNTANNSLRGGGGGGAGAAGGASTTTVTGAGGVGLSTYSSWGIATGTGENVSGVYFYAGGGSGATNQGGTELGGGSGGGGSTLGIRDGIPASGGGGAGAQDSSTSGKGGSGVVIVRYAK
jgi:hypothetical protein